MIRIIIVDDEILSRVGIQSFFDEEADVEVVGTFGMASEAIEFLRKNKVDIVITDIEMADINGLEFIQIIREEDLANGVIIVSCHSDFSYAQEAIAKGTNSYVLKHNISKQSLLEDVFMRQLSGRAVHPIIRLCSQKTNRFQRIVSTDLRL